MLKALPPTMSAIAVIERLFDAAARSHARAVAFLAILMLACGLSGFFTLQPIDRDETRFSQATTQMVETGDFIDIRFHDGPRYQKPIGIYWLQVAAIKLTGSEVPAPIWVHRLPSLLGAVGLVLGTYWAALAFGNRRMALLAGAIMAALILTSAETRLAKTDAVLNMAIVFAMGVLARLHMRQTAPLPDGVRSPGRSLPYIFWGASAVGILVKGPILPMVVIVTMIAVSVCRRSAGWLKPILSPIPFLLALALTLPWYVAIGIISDGLFFNLALGQDALGKITERREAHGAPPGVYLIAFWVTFWPAAAFFATAVPWVWRERKTPKLLFLLCWIIPTWIIFELIVTKLPHYVLPTYPAFAIITAMALTGGFAVLGRRWSRWLTVIAVAALIYGPPIALVFYGFFERSIPWFGLVLWLLLVPLGVAAVRAARNDRPLAALMTVIVAAPLVYLTIYDGALAHIETFKVSPNLKAAIDTEVACANPAVMTTRYREPSLVFLVGTDIRFGDAAAAVRFLQEPGCRVALIDQRTAEEFTTLLQEAERGATLRTTVTGINIGNSRPVAVGVYEAD